MRNPRTAAAALIATALADTACGSGSARAGRPYGTPTESNSATPASTSGAAASRTSALKVTRTSVGTVLASSWGLTLYYYAEDKTGSGKSVGTGGGASAWPPLAAPVRAPAGVHLPGRLGTITRPGGLRQVTLNGYPVYRFAGDKAPGQAAGKGS